MSVSIRSCPGCKALILADTFQCPDCGHVFDEDKADKLSGLQDLQTADVEDPCPDCGQMVRAGLVRCPDCGRFMREDIAQKYDAMKKTPQKIIYSDVPEEERTDYLPSRGEDGAPQPMGPVLDAEDDGFVLGDGSAPAAPVNSQPADGGFELGPGVGTTLPAGGTAPAPAQPDAAAAAEAAKTEAARTVDDPRETTDDQQKPGSAESTGPADGAGESADSPAKDAPTGGSSRGADIDVDGLLDIARADEKETNKRRVARRRADKARSILVPCVCGAWIRVREHQTGRAVRCRKCKRSLPIPQLAKKKSGNEEEKSEVDLPWLKDVDFVSVDPGNLKLKVGSVAADATPVDVLISSAGIAICSLTPEKSKGGLFAGKDKKPLTIDERRAGMQEFLNGGGSISSAPSEKTTFIPADKIEELLVAQPVKQAHESMFAGVAVFGEGRIAVRIPSASENSDKQMFLSLGLTDFRFLSRHLNDQLGQSGFGEDQGVPFDDKKTALKCHYTGLILNALAETGYYEADRHVDLTTLGRKCGACGIAVSEESRKKEKIGGASGRGLSRAKCPKCNGKFGNNSLYAFELKDTAPRLKADDAGDADQEDASADAEAPAAGE